MLELWIAIKVWIDYIIPAIIIVLLLSFMCAMCCIRSVKQKRKIKLLQSNGFERFLKDVPMYGNGAFYAWKNKHRRVCIDERDLEYMTYKELKAKIKG